jgi:hypothetical protein
MPGPIYQRLFAVVLLPALASCQLLGGATPVVVTASGPRDVGCVDGFKMGMLLSESPLTREFKVGKNSLGTMCAMHDSKITIAGQCVNKQIEVYASDAKTLDGCQVSFKATNPDAAQRVGKAVLAGLRSEYEPSIVQVSEGGKQCVITDGEDVINFGYVYDEISLTVSREKNNR